MSEPEERMRVECEECLGSGYWNDDEPCSTCGGSGETEVHCESCEDTGVVGNNRMPCPECDYWERGEE